MKLNSLLNFLGGISLTVGVFLALAVSSAWALFVVVGGLLMVIARRGAKKG